MNRFYIIGLLFAICWIPAFSQEKGYQEMNNTDGFKSAFAAASAKMTSFRADFTQEKNLSLLSEKIVSKGKFFFKKEKMVRMEYQQPFEYLMVINGNSVRVKDGQKSNTVSVRSNKLFQKINQITVDCVRGTALSNGDFQSKVFEGPNVYLLQLIPVTKELKDLFTGINIYLDKKDYSVSKINMLEKGGDNTLISFSQKEMNIPIADAVFAVK